MYAKPKQLILPQGENRKKLSFSNLGIHVSYNCDTWGVILHKAAMWSWKTLWPLHQTYSLGGGFKWFLYFSPEPWGNDPIWLIFSNGGFPKWWYPRTIGFPTKNDHFGVFWGYHHFNHQLDLPLVAGTWTFLWKPRFDRLTDQSSMVPVESLGCHQRSWDLGANTPEFWDGHTVDGSEIRLTSFHEKLNRTLPTPKLLELLDTQV